MGSHFVYIIRASEKRPQKAQDSHNSSGTIHTLSSRQGFSQEEAQPKPTNTRRTLAVGILMFAAGAAMAIVAMKTIPMGAPLEANVSEAAEEWAANDRVLSAGDCITDGVQPIHDYFYNHLGQCHVMFHQTLIDVNL